MPPPSPLGLPQRPAPSGGLASSGPEVENPAVRRPPFLAGTLWRGFWKVTSLKTSCRCPSLTHTSFYRTETLPGTQQGPEKHGLILFSTPATPPGRLPPSRRCWWQVWVFRSCAILPGPASMVRPLCLSSMAWGRQGHGQGALSACPLGVLRGRCDWQLRVFSMEEILRPPRHTHHLGWLGPLNPSNENQVQIK